MASGRKGNVLHEQAHERKSVQVAVERAPRRVVLELEDDLENPVDRANYEKRRDGQVCSEHLDGTSVRSLSKTDVQQAAA